jgi:hypothetical protein
MSYLTDSQIDEVVDLILTARDFCGDETDAVREWQLENNQLITFGDASQINARVRAEWARCQQAAGVKKPLTQTQRAKAYADLA